MPCDKNIHFIETPDIRFAYDGEWKFADLLTMSAGKLAVKFVMDTVTGAATHYHSNVIGIKY